jgi:hypothetical protein
MHLTSRSGSRSQSFGLRLQVMGGFELFAPIGDTSEPHMKHTHDELSLAKLQADPQG